MYKELEGLVVEERGRSRAKDARAEAGRAVWQPGKNVGTPRADVLFQKIFGSLHWHFSRPWTCSDHTVG